MECATHAEATAAGICTRCDKPICPDCTQERNGRTFCTECAAFLDTRESRRPAAARSAAPVAPGPSASPAGPGSPEAGGPGTQGDLFSAPGPELGLSAAAGGDVYGGPSADGGLYDGSPAAGDVYGREVYGGPAAASGGLGVGSAAGAAAPDQDGASLVRGLVYGLGAGFVGVMIWYGVVVLTDIKLGLVAIGVGSLAGFGVAAGARRQDMTVAMISAAIALAAMLLGEHMIWKHFLFGEEGVEAEYRDLVMEIGEDRYVSRGEVARYIAWGEDFRPEEVDLDQYSEEEISDIRRLLLEDFEVYRTGAQPERHAGLPLALFFSLLVSSPMSFVFFLIGAGAAFRIGLGGDDS